MANENGWVKLHRSFKSWGWASCPYTSHLFIHLLINANYEESEFLGHKINKGDCVFGLHAWSKKTCISVRSLRTSINHLKSTGEITIKSNNKFSIITITNWEKYQADDRQTDKPPTSNRQATDKPPTTSEEYKKERSKEEKKEESEILEKFSPDCHLICNALFQSIRGNDANFKIRSKKSWLTEADSLIKCDKRDAETIISVIKFSQNDPFWKSNILSVSSLRKKFTTLLLQMEQRKNQDPRFNKSDGVLKNAVLNIVNNPYRRKEANE
jgi:hypothetical protein